MPAQRGRSDGPAPADSKDTPTVSGRPASTFSPRTWSKNTRAVTGRSTAGEGERRLQDRQLVAVVGDVEPVRRQRQAFWAGTTTSTRSSGQTRRWSRPKLAVERFQPRAIRQRIATNPREQRIRGAQARQAANRSWRLSEHLSGPRPSGVTVTAESIGPDDNKPDQAEAGCHAARRPAADRLRFVRSRRSTDVRKRNVP